MSHREPGSYDPNAAPRENFPQQYGSAVAPPPPSPQPQAPLVPQNQPLPTGPVAVPPQPPQPAPDDAVSFELLQEKSKEWAEKGLYRHFEPDLNAAFYIKALTGRDLEVINKLTEDKPDEWTKEFIMRAVRKPIIDLPTWVMINRLSPSIKGRLVQAIREYSGMGDDALDKAKNSLRETDTDNTSGTDSPGI